jgi:hypothetical protein
MLGPLIRSRLVVVVAVLIISIASLRDMAAAEPTGTTGQEPAAEKQADPLAVAVDKAIEISTRRYLTGSVHTPWQIMHGLLALRQEYRIKQGDKKVNAVEWMSRGVTFRGEPWFEKTRFGGRAHPYSKAYAFEGHPNQFLAIVAMADIPRDHKFVTRGEETITVDDMVKHAQMEINAQTEVTWTLWALSHYLGTDANWRNKHGEVWSIERLVRIQIREPVRTAACGGSHGLFALTFARNAYIKTGRPLRGVGLEADQKIQRYIYEARYYQNADGTFSTNYFSGKSFSNKFETRLNTSGHTLEFLVLALPRQRLQEEWVRRGIHALTTDLINHRRDPAECGSLYHALNALVIYRDRTHPRPAAQVAAAKDASAADDAETTAGNEAPEKKPVEK